MPDSTRIKDVLHRIPIQVIAVLMGIFLFVTVAYAATRPANGRQTPEQLGNAEQVSPTPTPTPTPSEVPPAAPAPELPELEAAVQ